MTTKFVTDEQLGAFARRQNDLFRRVRDGSLPIELVMSSLQGIIEGNFDAAPRPSGRFIDCGAVPFIPDGWRIDPEDQLPNAVRGQIDFDSNKVKFYLDSSQRTGTIVGNDLKPKFADLPVLGAQALDHFLANTGIIPESWKLDEQGRTRYIYFWGTIYRGSDGVACVRFLCWDDVRWHWGFLWLDSGFGDRCVAAFLAS